MLGNLPLVQIDDQATNRFQQSVVGRLNLLAKVPFLDGRLIEDVNLAVGNNSIEHKLGRDLAGYLILNQNAASSIYNSTPTSQVGRFLFLNSSATVRVDLWVF